MATFSSCLPYVILNEGRGYEDGPNIDQPTNTGIILRDLAEYRNVPLSSVNDTQLARLSEEDIEGIYKKLFWDKLRLDEVTDDGIATCIFDIGVNRGLSIGAKYTQKVCNLLGAALVVDGQIGFRTIAAVNKTERKTFITQYEALVVSGYMAILASHPEDRIFEKGWLRRAQRLLTLI